MLQLTNIQFSYPDSRFLLDVPSFEAASCESIAIVGASGCGKTTLLELIAGILQPTAGSILLNETEIAQLSSAQAATHRLSTMGLVFQEFEMVRHLSILDNILLPLHLGLDSKQTLQDKAQDLAKSLGIVDLLHKKPQDVSQGERQRAAICRALCTSPQLILADEPTGNLDPDMKRTVIELILSEMRKQNSLFICATHDTALLDSFDRVIPFHEIQGGAK